MVLTVVVVEWGNYLGRAAEYIDKMRNMLARHLSQPYQFEVLRPTAGLKQDGCWPKLEIFKPGRAGRVLYLDLDTVIVGPLDELVKHKGAIHLADWHFPKNIHAGGILLWDGDERAHIWESLTPEVCKTFVNDQEWMTSLGCWDRLPPGLNVSYRHHAAAKVPEGAVTVSFHGEPKPHEVLTGWVPRLWQ